METRDDLADRGRRGGGLLHYFPPLWKHDAEKVVMSDPLVPTSLPPLSVCLPMSAYRVYLRFNMLYVVGQLPSRCHLFFSWPWPWGSLNSLLVPPQI